MDDRIPLDLFGERCAEYTAAPTSSRVLQQLSRQLGLSVAPLSLCVCAGRPLLVGSRPLQLWPLLLCKAILKVQAVYRSLDKTLPHQVRAGVWLEIPATRTWALSWGQFWLLMDNLLSTSVRHC